MKNNPPRFILSLRVLAVLPAVCAMLGTPASAQQPGSSPVKIYLMVGQSNMQGTGLISPVTTPGTLEYIVANDPGNHYQFLVDGVGDWIVRDDVWMHYERAIGALDVGELEPGYGASSANTSIGPELGFGHKMGDLHGNQVLLVKTAWGGKSLYNDFLPPSSRIGQPEPRTSGDAGFYYQEVLRLMNDATSNLGTYFPDYDGQGYQIAGICWHQGWNDGGRPRREYETNMANLIRDIRSDLGVPDCPFVIATSGMAGVKDIEAAQLAMEDYTTYPEFDGNVSVIDTRAETYLGYAYEQSVADSPVNLDYHWNRNARTYLHIGLAMGDAMAALNLSRCPSRLAADGNGGSAGVTLTWQNGSETPTSVRILRDNVEIAAAAPVVPASYVDSAALPGNHEYELQFTMPGDPCDPLTVTHHSGITGLTAYRSPTGVVLDWENNLTYAGIEVRRNGAVIQAALSGTSTTYQDTGAPASGVVIYSVTPTTETSVPTEVAINLGPQLAGSAVIYEPYDFPSGTALSGAAGGAGLGAWSGGGVIEPLSLEFINHPTAGNRYSGNGSTAGWAGIGSSLSAAGLLNDGAELWFSFLVQPGSSSGDNGFIGLSSATGNFGTGFSSVPAGANVLGFWFQNGSDLQLATAVSGTPSSATTGKNDLPLTLPTLVVGKITWGADSAANDTLQLYLPKSDRLQPTSATASKTAVIDQSTFSQLGVWMANANSLLDEVRFGATYAAVVGAGYETQLDFFPPTPAQMTWASPPAGASDAAISMTAVTASDENGVEYYFTCTSGGGHDSGWQDSPIYIDTGLTPSSAYSYTVLARDKSLNQNTNTVSSPPAGATTFPPDTNPPPVPTFVTPLGPVGRTTITVSANPVVDGEGSIVEYRFHNTTLATDSGWLSAPTWTEGGLLPGTTCFYTVQSRDIAASHNESAQSLPQSATTLDGAVTIADSFTYKFDYTPGDDISDTLGGPASPITISTSGFTAAGSGKLVAVLCLHNSAAQVAPITSVTYGGANLLGKIVTGTTYASNSTPRMFIFHLDYPATDGDFVIGFNDSSKHIDEVGLQLFALNGIEPGTAFASESKVSGAFTPVNAIAGDFIVGVAQRNNQSGTITVTNKPPYSEFDLTAGNQTARVGYQVASVNGPTAPTFTGSIQFESMAAFAATTVPQVTVPDVTGLAQASAESAITGALLTVGAVTTAYSATVSSGDVISQSPVGGSTVGEGTSVNLVVSLGPQPQVTVPNVVGLTQAAAESAITGASLTVGAVTTAYSPTVPAGDVISQNPAGGSTVGEGTGVDLVVSLGTEPLEVTVPDVVGLAQSAAQSAITGASLTVGAVTTAYNATVPAGAVISQDPAAGLTVNEGTDVALVVSLGPPSGLITIADVFSFSVDAATSATYSSNPGSDGGGTNLYSADSPISISTGSFNAIGTKLVAVLSLHNSAAVTSVPTNVTFGGVALNQVGGISTGSNNTGQYVYYLDNVASNGSFSFSFEVLTGSGTFQSTHRGVDEVGLQLFALNGAAIGTAYASQSSSFGGTGTPFSSPADALAGDFIVGVAQRNNGGTSITVGSPYTSTSLTAGNNGVTTGHLIANSSGFTAPVFSKPSGGATVYQSFAAFAAVVMPPTSPYDDWAATNAPNTGNDPTADEDDDGVNNGVEFVIGGTLSTNDLDKLPTVSTDGTSMIFSFQRAQQSISSSVAVSIEVGTDLATWPDHYPVPDDTTAGPPVAVEKDTSLGMDTVTLSVPMAPDAIKFARLKVVITDL